MSDNIDWHRPSWRDRFVESAGSEFLLPEDAQPDIVVPAASTAPARPVPVFHGGNRRRQGGGLARFLGTGHHADRRSAALPAGHAALTEMRTLFPSTVVEAAASPRILVSGHNSSKIGAKVMKGPWAGFPIYTVTLEERATCPTSCALLRECYGNAMPFARRHVHGPDLIEALNRELRAKARKHRGGFAVRLHVLGDFPNEDYLLSWFRWMNCIPQLHVWGYTAHQADSAIGAYVLRGNTTWPGRWVFRTSVEPNAPANAAQATTIWRADARGRQHEGIVCPAQTGDTDACATCGLCWAPAAMRERIVFIGHGKKASVPAHLKKAVV